MYWLTMALFFVVGILIGVLATLIIDGRILGKLVQKAWSATYQFQTRLREVTSHLTASATQVHNLSHELYALTKKIEDISADNQTQRRELVTAVAKKEVYSTQYARLSGQLDKLRAEHQLAQRRLTVAAIELKRLRHDLEAAQSVPQPLEQEQADGQLIQEAQTSGLQAELHAFQRSRELAKTAETEEESQIEAVHGIGAAYARRLHESGIHSLADLARQTPETLAEIIGLKSSQRTKSQAWIDEARELAAAFSGGAEFGLQAVSPPRATNQ